MSRDPNLLDLDQRYLNRLDYRRTLAAVHHGSRPSIMQQLLGLLQNRPELSWGQVQREFSDCELRPTEAEYREAVRLVT